MKKIIEESQHYRLECSENPYDNNLLQYLVINKDTGVIEADSRMLPMAKKYIMELEAYYNAIDDIASDDDFSDVQEFDLGSLNKIKFN